MIAYLEGKLLKKETDRVVLLVNHIGYEILVPAFVMETIQPKSVGDELSFYIYYYQTEHQPKPVLIGFNLEAEREFFQLFISVEAIGPMKAVKALNFPVCDIARAIESKDAGMLKRLNGIGERTANKIIATLYGRTSRFGLLRKPENGVTYAPASAAGFIEQVVEVLVGQLGHRTGEAREMVQAAVIRKPHISSAEELFDEIYRGQSLTE